MTGQWLKDWRLARNPEVVTALARSE